MQAAQLATLLKPTHYSLNVDHDAKAILSFAFFFSMVLPTNWPGNHELLCIRRVNNISHSTAIFISVIIYQWRATTKKVVFVFVNFKWLDKYHFTPLCKLQLSWWWCLFVNVNPCSRLFVDEASYYAIVALYDVCVCVANTKWLASEIHLLINA